MHATQQKLNNLDKPALPESTNCPFPLICLPAGSSWPLSAISYMSASCVLRGHLGIFNIAAVAVARRYRPRSVMVYYLCIFNSLLHIFRTFFYITSRPRLGRAYKCVLQLDYSRVPHTRILKTLRWSTPHLTFHVSVVFQKSLLVRIIWPPRVDASR